MKEMIMKYEIKSQEIWKIDATRDSTDAFVDLSLC